MLAQITYRQFIEWVVYGDLEPFDEERADIRSAHIVTALANIHRDRKKRRAPFKIRDFLLPFGDQSLPAKKSLQQLKTVAKLWVAVMNADQKKPTTRPKKKG